MQKVSPHFVCEKCDYSCKKTFLWKQHIKTIKHKKQCTTQAVKAEVCDNILIIKLLDIVKEQDKRIRELESKNQHLPCQEKLS